MAQAAEPRVLVVEDEPNFTDLVAPALRVAQPVAEKRPLPVVAGAG